MSTTQFLAMLAVVFVAPRLSESASFVLAITALAAALLSHFIT